MTGADPRYDRGDARDETPLHHRCGGVSSSRQGGPATGGGKAPALPRVSGRRPEQVVIQKT
jgi:hypothetical protein